jgi:hypothetical protein
MSDKLEDQKFLSVDDRYETWFNTNWRPSAAWLYMATCAFDFIIAPICWAIIQGYYGKQITPWVPLTLQGAGLYHMAMGAIIGVTAWSRGQEKISAMNLSMNYTDPEIADRKRAAIRKKARQSNDADATIGDKKPI